MHRNNGCAPFEAPKLYVAAALADSLEAESGKSLDRLLARYDRQALVQALSSRVAMIGDSISVGSGWSSYRSSKAS